MISTVGQEPLQNLAHINNYLLTNIVVSGNPNTLKDEKYLQELWDSGNAPEGVVD